MFKEFFERLNQKNIKRLEEMDKERRKLLEEVEESSRKVQKARQERDEAKREWEFIRDNPDQCMQEEEEEIKKSIEEKERYIEAQKKIAKQYERMNRPEEKK